MRRVRPFLGSVPDIVKEGVQLPFRRNRRVQVAEGAGGRIAGVLQRLGGRFVVLFQNGEIHEALALHLDDPVIVRDAGRHGADRAHLRQYALADRSVAASGRLSQDAVLIGQIWMSLSVAAFFLLRLFKSMNGSMFWWSRRR